MKHLSVSIIIIISLLAQVITGADLRFVVNEVEDCCCTVCAEEISEMAHQCGCQFEESEAPIHEEATPAPVAVSVHVPTTLIAIAQPLFELPLFYHEQVVTFNTGPPGLFPHRAIYLQTNRFLC